MLRLPLFSWTVLSAALLLALPSPAMADTARDVSKIEGLLRRAKVNLESVVLNMAGRDRWPQGSAGKLLAMRLEQAGSDLQPAGELVQQLPATGPGVAEVREQYQQMAEVYNRLVALQNGGAEPQPNAGATEGTVKLGYPHADQFKNAVFTLQHKVEQPANQLTELQAELQPVEDQLTINYRKSGNALDLIEETRRQAGFAETALAKIPANGEGVAEAKERLAAARKALDGSEAYFRPLHEKLLTIVDPNRYPSFQQDVERMRALSGDYAAEFIFRTDRRRAAELFGQRPQAHAEVVRIAQVYARPLQQKPAWIQPLEASGNRALSGFQVFDARIEEQRQALPGEIRGHLAQAEKLADEAVREQKPAWFTGGIPQEMGFAEDKLTLITAIDPPTGGTLQNEFEQMQTEPRQRAESLKELIIQENTPPPNNFQGADRQKAIDAAFDAWKHQEEGFKVLAAAIPAEAWTREQKHSFDGSIHANTGNISGEWSKQDRSKIQVQLLIAVKDDPKLAKIIPVTVYKDHMRGDTMFGTPLFAGDEELPPRFFLLRETIH